LKTHGDILRVTVTVKNVFNDTIVIGMKALIVETHVRDWVLINTLDHEYSINYHEDNDLDRGWETLAPGDESTVVGQVGICTIGCSFGNVVTPSDYYYVPMIYPDSGHPYAPYLFSDLYHFLKDNYKHIMYDEFVYDAITNLDRLGYQMITVQ